jgi:protein SCO1/2
VGDGTRRLRLALVGALAAVLLAACGGADATTAPFTGLTHQPYQVSATPLTDTEGDPYSLVGDTDKRLTLVFFGYTRCPDICPLVLNTLAAGLTRLDEADREQVDVVFVTTDPTVDTGPVLRTYLDRYDPTFIGLTGDITTIAAVGEPLAVYVAEGEKLPTGGYDLNAHSTQISAVDADDRSPVLWTQDTSSAQFAADIHTLLGKS